jgi:hypothetical protein
VLSANANSDYNALEMGYVRRRARLVAGVYFVWSHALDDVQDPAVYGSTQPQDNRNLRAEWGNSSGDARRRVSGNVVYDLPSGRQVLFRGWKLAGIGLFRTGIAQTVLIGANTSGTGNLTNQRPDAVSGLSPYPARQTTSGWYNPAAFRLPAPGTFGNLGRNTVYGPGLAQVDLALMKQTRVRERAEIRWRAQVFNNLNRSVLAQPNNVLGTAAFGQILSTLGNAIGLGTARQIPLAALVSF